MSRIAEIHQMLVDNPRDILRDEAPVRVRLFVGGEHAASYDQILAVARSAEATGFDGLFRSDHFMSTGSRTAPVRRPTPHHVGRAGT